MHFLQIIWKQNQNTFPFPTKNTWLCPAHTFKFMIITLFHLQKVKDGRENIRHSSFLKYYSAGVYFVHWLLCVVLCFRLLKGSGGAVEKSATLFCWISPTGIQGTLLMTGEIMFSLEAVKLVQVDFSGVQEFRGKAVWGIWNKKPEVPAGTVSLLM